MNNDIKKFFETAGVKAPVCLKEMPERGDFDLDILNQIRKQISIVRYDHLNISYEVVQEVLDEELFGGFFLVFDGFVIVKNDEENGLKLVKDTLQGIVDEQ